MHISELGLSLLRRILTSEIADAQIPKDKIGEEKEYHWRASSINHEPILIHGESGKAVAGVGKTDKEWEEHHNNRNSTTETKDKITDKYQDLDDIKWAMSGKGMRVSAIAQDIREQFNEKQVDAVLNVSYDFLGQYQGCWRDKDTMNIAYDMNDIANAAYVKLSINHKTGEVGATLTLTRHYKESKVLSGETTSSYTIKNPTYESVVQHEMTHILDAVVGSQTMHAEDLDALREDANELDNYIKIAKARDKAGNTFRNHFPKYIVKRAANIAGIKKMKEALPSDYARDSIAKGEWCEALAEAFADVYTNGDSAKDLSKAIYKEMNDFVKLDKSQWQEKFYNDVNNDEKGMGKITKAQEKRLRECQLLMDYYDGGDEFTGHTQLAAEWYLEKHKYWIKSKYEEAQTVHGPQWFENIEEYRAYRKLQEELGFWG